MELEDISIHRWIERNKLKTESGLPINFHDHPYLFDIISDLASLKKDIVAYKAAQIGFSTMAILAILWIAKKKSIDLIYTLPTAEDIRQFVGGKINRIIAQNPSLQEWVKEKDTIEQKTVGGNIAYFRGTFTTKSATMVSSDLNVYDEVDASNQDVIEQYETRLQHSKLKRQWYFSHPSVPGNGVSKYWDRSDQKHWFITCPECKKEQYLSWPESIDIERKVYQCKKCFHELSDDDRRVGRWIQKYKDREFSGYWIPLLICPYISAAEIINYKNTKSEEYFTNKVLGLPYVGGGNKVTQNIIFDNLTNAVNTQEGRTIIGVDTGIDIRYVRMNNEGIFHYGQLDAPRDDYDPYTDLEKMLRDDDTAIMVIDQGGDIIGSRRLREKFPGRVFLCHYSVERKTYELIRWGENEERGSVHVDRNRMMQLLIDELREKRIPIYGTESDWYDYWLHWSHIYRVAEEDALGVIRYKWMRSDRDDWVHATLYARVGMDRFGGPRGSVMFQNRTLNVKKGIDTLGDKAIAPQIVTNFGESYDWRND